MRRNFVRKYFAFYADIKSKSKLTISIVPVVGWLVVYSRCSHLEHKASVKRFVSLQFLNLRHSVGHLGRVISPSQGRYLKQTE
jgi:hypothetical protein